MDYQALWIVYADGGRGGVVRGADSREGALQAFLSTVEPNEVQNVGARKCRDHSDLAKALSKYRLIDA